LVPLYQALAGLDVNFVPADAPHGPLGLSKAAGGFARAANSEGRPDVQFLTLLEPGFLPFKEEPFDIRGDDVLLLLLLAGTISFFLGGEYDLRRSAIDDEAG